MKFSHFSSEPLGELHDVEEQPRRDGMKPRGLWLSVDGKHDWASWCRAERFGLSKYVLRQSVILKKDCNVLVIGTPAELEGFMKEYRHALYPGGRRQWINWVPVADKWDGVVISPYQWSYRLAFDYIWYYSWDCASACIWRPTKVIESVGYAEEVNWEDQHD